MHIMDAMAAVMVLVFFGLSSFTVHHNLNDWGAYENKIAAKDLSQVFKDTGYMQDFLRQGETGTIKTALAAVSERDMDVGGEIKGVPPNMKIGFYTPPSDLSHVKLTNVSAGDACYGDLSEISKRSASTLLRTKSGSMESSHGGYRLYVGNYHRFTNRASRADYNAIWITDGTGCDVPNPDNPIMKGEIFQWGPGADTFEFRNVKEEITQRGKITNGTLDLADAEQIKRFQNTFNEKVGAINNRIKINSFTLKDDTSGLDMLVFRQKKSVQRIENGRRKKVKRKIKDKPALFLVNLNSTMLQDGRFMNEKGFRWVDLPLYAENGAKCTLTPDSSSISPGCKPDISFSSSANSQQMKDDVLGLETDLSEVSLYPGGHVMTRSRGVLSYEKPLSLDNFGYRNISENSMNLGMSSVNLDPGDAPYTTCENATQGLFQFPYINGTMQGVRVVNTQLGESQSYCSRNTRAVYIDRNGDGMYSDKDEGPFLDGERIDVNGITYTVNIISSAKPGCSVGECLRFKNVENADISALNYITSEKIGRAGYEKVYSEADRKVLASFMYMMQGSTIIPTSTEGDFSTNIYGVLGNQAYRATLRWSN